MLHSLRTATTPRPPRHLTRPRRLLVRSAPAAAPSDALQHAVGIEHLFVHARDALVVIEIASDRILRWNPAAERLFGYSVAEAVNQNVRLLMPSGVARVHRERMAHYQRTGDAEVLPSRPMSVPALHRSGTELRVELSVSAIDVPGVPPRWVLLAFRDARCLHEVELASQSKAQAEAARSELETQLGACKRLVADTARAVGKPLDRAQRSASRLARLAATAADDPRGRLKLKLLARVVEARTRRAQRSLEDVATAASIHDGTFELHTERVNLVPLVSRLVASARECAPLHRIKMSAPQGLSVEGDASRIEAVITDLLERAIRRNPRGCWIDVDLRRPLVGVAQIAIRDYGRKFNDRERQPLVEPGAVGDRRWFINRHIVSAHRGTLSVEFPPEGGLRASMSLPTHRRKSPA